MNKHKATLTEFERGVRLIMFDHPPVTITEANGDRLVDVVRSFRRLENFAKNHANIHVELEISEEEAWIGVYCAEQELELYYSLTKEGEATFTNGRDKENPRVRSCFGPSLGFCDFAGDLPANRIAARLSRYVK